MNEFEAELDTDGEPDTDDDIDPVGEVVDELDLVPEADLEEEAVVVGAFVATPVTTVGVAVAEEDLDGRELTVACAEKTVGVFVAVDDCVGLGDAIDDRVAVSDGFAVLVLKLDRVAEGDLADEDDGNADRDTDGEYVDEDDIDGEEVVETELLPLADAETDADDDTVGKGVLDVVVVFVDVFVPVEDLVEEDEVVGVGDAVVDLEDVAVLAEVVVGLGDLDADLETDEERVTVLEGEFVTDVETVDVGERVGETDDDDDDEIVGELDGVTDSEGEGVVVDD